MSEPSLPEERYVSTWATALARRGRGGRPDRRHHLVRQGLEQRHRRADGVRYRAGGATTHSLVMRSRSGTIRVIESEHQLSKLSASSAIDYDNAGSKA